MKLPAQADLQRWSDEVARDPRSLAFLPLARAYRKQGLHDAALSLCLRGLAAYPNHVDAHGLLALLYLDGGDHQRAADEWSMVLRVDPDNFDALRGLGFCYLEQDRLSKARQLLERAALLRPADPTVQEALRVLGTRQELAREGLSRHHGAPVVDEPWAQYEGEPRFMLEDPHGREPGELILDEPVADSARANEAAELEPWAQSEPAQTEAAPAHTQDPTQLFDSLLAAGPLLGALLIDAQGLVLAGRFTDAVAGDATVMGAVLGGAIDEATRTAKHLQLGSWRAILLEVDQALLHLSPAGADSVLVLAARRDAPTGWIMRAAQQAVTRAQRYMEEYG